MSGVLSTIASFLLAASAYGSGTPLLTAIPQENWRPHVGDTFFVDTKENLGYLIHSNGEYTSFPVVTGQRRNVYYIGRYYDATTPTWEWSAASRHIKGDRVTFGPTGRFLRLYKNGDERTAYGIHGHRDAEQMLKEEDRYRSMGCIIVSEDILNVIEQTFEMSSGNLSVITQYGIPDNFALSILEKEEKTY